MWMNTNLEKEGVKNLIPRSRLYKDEVCFMANYKAWSYPCGFILDFLLLFLKENIQVEYVALAYVCRNTFLVLKTGLQM